MRDPIQDQNYLNIGRRFRSYRGKRRPGGAGVLKKRKAKRDPEVAWNMALIRARGPLAPGNRARNGIVLDEMN